MAVRLSALRACRTLFPRNIIILVFLVLISVRCWVNPRALYIYYVEESRPPLWSSGRCSWLLNGEVFCFLWGTNWIYVCYLEEIRPLLWSSCQSSWLHNGDVLCFLWGTNWIYICFVEESRPHLWSIGRSSWLHIQGSGFDNRRYRIFWGVVDYKPRKLDTCMERYLCPWTWTTLAVTCCVLFIGRRCSAEHYHCRGLFIHTLLCNTWSRKTDALNL
jgi:hypothetical protein